MKTIDIIAYAGMFLGAALCMVAFRVGLGFSKWLSIILSVPLGAILAVAFGAAGLKVYAFFESSSDNS